MHERLVTTSFRRAVADYSFLVERSYARSSALKLVGDRYQLSSTQRSVLYRGVSSAAEATSRTGKITQNVVELPLHVDGLNVLYTVANYLYGKVLFLSTDGWLRDAAEVHGAKAGASRKHGEILDEAVSILFWWLARNRPIRVDFYLDRPVSLSGELAARLRSRLAELELPGSAVTIQSADFALKRVIDAVVATSDSTIIDACRCRVCDLAYLVLSERFSPLFVDLRQIVSEPVPPVE